MSTRKTYGEKIVTNSGMGGFLNPPGHPEHSMSVQTGRSDNPNGIYSLSSAINSEWLSPGLRGRCSGILKRWEANKLPLEHEDVQEWICHVLGYFKGCYKGQTKDGAESWNASDLKIDSECDPMTRADDHAGVHLIRKYYPEYQPRIEHFEHAYWGSKSETVKA